MRAASWRVRRGATLERMRVYLVHHAQTVSSAVDPMRPLSSDGLAHAARLAEALKARGAHPVAMWHSGKLRARQTAEACWRACNPMATYSAVRGLRPEDDPDTMAVTLEAEDRDVLLVGHRPHLPALLHRLITGRRDHGSATFPLHGCVALERVGGRWQELWREGGSGATADAG